MVTKYQRMKGGGWIFFSALDINTKYLYQTI